MSEMRANKLASQSGLKPTELHMQWASKVLLDMNGGGVIAARMSKNVSSLVDIGPGQFQANITTAMLSSAYPVLITGSATGQDTTSQMVSSLNYNLAKNSGTFGIASINLAKAWWDDPNLSAIVGGDLA